MADLKVVVSGDASGAKQALSETESAVQGTVGKLQGGATVVGAAFAAMGAAVLAGIGAAVNEATKYQTLIENVKNNTNMSQQAAQAMSSAIQSMSSQSGASLEELAHGFEHISNFGYKGADATNILNAAMQSAVSTGASVSDVANTLAAVMKEYAFNANDAGRAMDVLHTAAASGNMTLESLVENGSRAIAMAANLHVGLEDVTAVMSTLTSHGLDAAMAGTQVVNMLSKIAMPSAAARDELAKLSQTTGVDLVSDFSVAGLQAKGLTGVLQDMQKAAGGNEEEILRLIPNLRGTIGALIATGTGAQDLATRLDVLNSAWQSGHVSADAYASKLLTTGQQMAILEANGRLLAIAIGQTLLGAVNDILGPLTAAARATTDWANAHPALTGKIMETAAVLGVLATGVGAAVLVIPKLVAGYEALTAAVTLFRAGALASVDGTAAMAASEAVAAGGGAALLTRLGGLLSAANGATAAVGGLVPALVLGGLGAMAFSDALDHLTLTSAKWKDSAAAVAAAQKQSASDMSAAMATFAGNGRDTEATLAALGNGIAQEQGKLTTAKEAVIAYADAHHIAWKDLGDGQFALSGTDDALLKLTATSVYYGSNVKILTGDQATLTQKFAESADGQGLLSGAMLHHIDILNRNTTAVKADVAAESEANDALHSTQASYAAVLANKESDTTITTQLADAVKKAGTSAVEGANFQTMLNAALQSGGHALLDVSQLTDKYGGALKATSPDAKAASDTQALLNAAVERFGPAGAQAAVQYGQLLDALGMTPSKAQPVEQSFNEILGLLNNVVTSANTAQDAMLKVFSAPTAEETHFDAQTKQLQQTVAGYQLQIQQSEPSNRFVAGIQSQIDHMVLSGTATDAAGASTQQYEQALVARTTALANDTTGQAANIVQLQNNIDTINDQITTLEDQAKTYATTRDAQAAATKDLLNMGYTQDQVNQIFAEGAAKIQGSQQQVQSAVSDTASTVQQAGADIQAAISAASTGVTTGVAAMSVGLSSFPGVVTSAASDTEAASAGIASAITTTETQVGTSVAAMSVGISSLPGVAVTAATGIASAMNTASTGVSTSLSAMSVGISALPGVVQTAASGTQAGTDAIGQHLDDAAKQADAAKTGVTTSMAGLTTAVTTAQAGVGTATSAIDTALGTIPTAAGLAVSQANAVLATLGQGLDATAYAQGQAIGSALVLGVAAGIANNQNIAVSAAASMAAAAVAAAQGPQGIAAASPSKKGIALGGYFAEGLALGLTASIPQVQTAATGMVNDGLRGTYDAAVEWGHKAGTGHTDAVASSITDGTPKVKATARQHIDAVYVEMVNTIQGEPPLPSFAGFAGDASDAAAVKAFSDLAKTYTDVLRGQNEVAKQLRAMNLADAQLSDTAVTQADLDADQAQMDAARSQYSQLLGLVQDYQQRVIADVQSGNAEQLKLDKDALDGVTTLINGAFSQWHDALTQLKSDQKSVADAAKAASAQQLDDAKQFSDAQKALAANDASLDKALGIESVTNYRGVTQAKLAADTAAQASKRAAALAAVAAEHAIDQQVQADAVTLNAAQTESARATAKDQLDLDKVKQSSAHDAVTAALADQAQYTATVINDQSGLAKQNKEVLGLMGKDQADAINQTIAEWQRAADAKIQLDTKLSAAEKAGLLQNVNDQADALRAQAAAQQANLNTDVAGYRAFVADEQQAYAKLAADKSALDEAIKNGASAAEQAALQATIAADQGRINADDTAAQSVIDNYGKESAAAQKAADAAIKAATATADAQISQSDRATTAVVANAQAQAGAASAGGMPSNAPGNTDDLAAAGRLINIPDGKGGTTLGFSGETLFQGGPGDAAAQLALARAKADAAVYAAQLIKQGGFSAEALAKIPGIDALEAAFGSHIDALIAEINRRYPNLAASATTPVPVTITNPLPLSAPVATAPIIGGTPEAAATAQSLSAASVSLTAQTVQLAGPVSITVNLPGQPSQTVQAQLFASQQNTVTLAGGVP